MAGRSTGLSILVVEDDEKLRVMLRRTLRAAGWQVRVVEDGLQALSALAWEVPDLLLTDVDMPNLNGIELGEAVRERFPALPIVFMSGNPEAQTLRLSPHFLPKPFSLPSLDAILAWVLAAVLARRSVAG